MEVVTTFKPFMELKFFTIKPFKAFKVLVVNLMMKFNNFKILFLQLNYKQQFIFYLYDLYIPCFSCNSFLIYSFVHFLKHNHPILDYISKLQSIYLI